MHLWITPASIQQFQSQLDGKPESEGRRSGQSAATIILADGSFFGTLCVIDPHPARLKTPEMIGMFRLFADLIAKHLDADRKLAATESALI
jgi:hypothetical protein